MRSTRFPSAPPKMNANARLTREKRGADFHSTTKIPISTAEEKVINPAVVYCDRDSANRLKAAPRFITWERLKKPGIMGTAPCSGMLREITILVYWSSTTTNSDMPKYQSR